MFWSLKLKRKNQSIIKLGNNIIKKYNQNNIALSEAYQTPQDSPCGESCREKEVILRCYIPNNI